MKPESKVNTSARYAPPRAARLHLLLKSAVGNALREHHPRLYRACSGSYAFLRFLPMFVSKAARRTFAGQDASGELSGGQAILDWRVNLPKLDTASELPEWLKLNGIHYEEGGHTIYIPPQEQLRKCFGRVVDFYPEDAGFKILKNLGPATTVDYAHGHRNLWMRNRLIGGLSERVLAANFLHMHGLGPRVWDLTNWHGNGNIFSVFVVAHVSGPEAGHDDSVVFLDKLSEMIEKRLIEVLQPNWRRLDDFSLPSCNHNLLYSNQLDCFLFVDFQDFSIVDHEAAIKTLCTERKDAFHFGQSRFFRDERYLYQSVPSVTDGKRDTDRRWQFLTSQLATAGISIKSRIVLDVGCNAGMILNCALRDGALWGFGWDLPSVVSNANDLLLLLGAARFTLTGAQLNETYPLEDDIPHRFAPYLGESVMFYLSVSNQIGYLQSLYRIPWRILVYEGHQDQSESEIANEAWSKFGPDVQLLTVTRNADGDSLPRPWALFLRRSPPRADVSDDIGAVVPMYANDDS